MSLNHVNIEKLYNERLNRYVSAMKNEQPDRIPIRLFAEEFAAKYAGYSNHEAAIDYDIAFEATRKCGKGLGVDSIMTNAIVNWWGMSEALGWKGVYFPGINSPLNSVTQWTEPSNEEDAYMKAEEYDQFISDPTYFLLNIWFPRFSKYIKPIGEQTTFENNVALINGTMAYLTYMEAFAKYADILKTQEGIVPANAGTLKAPLDILADKLRGYVNLCYDIYERRDKVVALCEALMPHLLTAALAGADPDKKVPITIWMHRGCVPFVSKDIFDNIYWATLKPIIEEIYAKGYQVLFYAEGDWSYHLNKFAELPDKSIIFHIDKTNIFEAKKILGKKFCLSGGIPNELLSFGTPEKVRDYCKNVIDGVAKDGGYIMDASALIMDDAKVENVKAMIDFTLDYGVYKHSYTVNESNKDGHIMKTDDIKIYGKRKPGVCIPWEDKLKELGDIDGNKTLMKKVWENLDRMGYNFIWTNLTW